MPPRIFALSLVLVAVCAAACFGDEDDQPSGSPTPSGAIATLTPAPERTVTPTPRPAASPSPAPSLTPSGEVEYNGFEIFGDFTYASAVEFRENLLLLIATGCAQCDGPTEALYRVWRNQVETHVELLIDAAISEEEGAFISSFALRPDLSDIMVSVCVTGDCGLGGAGPTSITTLYRSRDGGVTWTAERTSEPGQWLIPVAVTDGGIVVVEPGRNYRYLDGGSIEPPEGAEDLIGASRTGELLWRAAGGSEVLNADGSRFAVVEPGGEIGSLAVHRDTGVPVVAWVNGPPSSTGFAQWNVTRPTEDFLHIGFKTTDFPRLVTVLHDGGVLGSLYSDTNPTGGSIAYFDVERGVITPIAGALIEAPFGDGQLARGRNALQGAVEGPFLRVTTTTPCESIRAGTDSQSEELTCAVDGVLVHDLGTTVTVGQQMLRQVRLLDGREGYIAAEVVTAEP